MTTPAKQLFGLRRRQPAVGLGCILAGLFFLGPAIGQGEGGAYVPPSEPANEYLDAIDRIEGDFGPYATELSDLYLGLGQTLVDSGEYEKAKDAFHRGVMVVRVNSGPNSPEQTNHLYQLADIETLLGELNTADKILHNIYFVNEDYYGEDSPELLPVIDRIYEWYMVRRPPGSLILDHSDYERFIDMADKAADISEATKGPNHADTALANRRLAEAEFQMVRHLTGVGMTLTPESYVAATSGSLQPMGFGSESVVKHYDKGRRAFKNYLDSMLANESTTPLEYAEALADLGDWYMVFQKHRRSRNFYKQGYQILARSEDYAELADSYMNQPKPMHFIVNTRAAYLEDDQTEFQEFKLNISITVTSAGDVRSIEVLNAPEDLSNDVLGEIVKQLRDTPFRPAMKEGEVVTTRDFIWHYPIVRQGRAS